MRTLPEAMLRLLAPVAPLFSCRVWSHVQVLVAGAILFVKASGLRWVCLMLLVPIPWAGRVWALPFLTALAPSERYHRQRGRRHKTLTEWAWQVLLQVRRWLPERALVVVADSTYACLELLARCQRLARPITVITRLRLDAALYAPAPPRRPGQKGRPRLKGDRLPTLAQRLTDATTQWTTITVAPWYGHGERTVEVASETAVWYHSGLPPVPIRWVLIRDPHGQFAPRHSCAPSRVLIRPRSSPGSSCAGNWR